MTFVPKQHLNLTAVFLLSFFPTKSQWPNLKPLSVICFCSTEPEIKRLFFSALSTLFYQIQQSQEHQNHKTVNSPHGRPELSKRSRSIRRTMEAIKDSWTKEDGIQRQAVKERGDGSGGLISSARLRRHHQDSWHGQTQQWLISHITQE